jgi:phospholipid/cholesterol/gamma-HCH transport system ATP-binding protein
MNLSVKGVSKSFGRKSILNNISFEMNDADSLAIIGESGCGKTTLMRIIAGLLKQKSGSIAFVDKFGNKMAPTIGYAFQLNALFDSYTIWQNVLFKNYIEEINTKDEICEKVAKILKLVNLSLDVMNLYPKDISGGMQKRVAIARAIATNPNILLFDEPTSGLDPYTSTKIIETINQLNLLDGTKPMKISIVHDMKILKAISNKTLFLKSGRISWFGETNSIESTDNEELRRFLFL